MYLLFKELQKVICGAVPVMQTAFWWWEMCGAKIYTKYAVTDTYLSEAVTAT